MLGKNQRLELEQLTPGARRGNARVLAKQIRGAQGITGRVDLVSLIGEDRLLKFVGPNL